MENKNILSKIKLIYWFTISIFSIVILLFIGAIFYHIEPSIISFTFNNNTTISETIEVKLEDNTLIKDGIHVNTGLKEGEGLMLVVQNCTSCHSAKMITQNRATKEGWRSMIKWMQQTQNLWSLGENEEKIIAYLAKQYAPQKKGRRSTLSNIEWYTLE